MIQDISPHVLNNSFKPRKPEKGDYILIYGDEKVMLLNNSAGGVDSDASVKTGGAAIVSGGGSPSSGGGLSFPSYELLESLAPDCRDALIYLFHIDEAVFFFMRRDKLPGDASSRFSEAPMGSFRSYTDKWLGFAGITACHLAGWYERHRMCGKCGGNTKHSEKERMLECPVCGAIYYPGISPAVIVGVTSGSRLLLSRYANRPVVNFALIAGFCEIGESVEDTVRREVMEEVGINVKNIRFYKSQPWGFSSSLLMGFYCDLDGSDAITLDQNELSSAEWFDRSDIAVTDTSISLTSEMIETFRLGAV